MSDFDETIYNMLHDITVELAALSAQNEEILKTLRGGKPSELTKPKTFHSHPGKITGLCPKCGGPMLRRHGSRGDFAGCANFPECHGTMDIAEATDPTKNLPDPSKGRVYCLKPRKNPNQTDLF